MLAYNSAKTNINNMISSDLSIILSYLKYPLDVNKILRKKKLIKKYLLLNDNLIKKIIAILGRLYHFRNKEHTRPFLTKNGIKPKFYESEYNKYYEDALFGNDELDKFNPDIIYIHTTNQNIIKYPELKDTSEECRYAFKQ